MTSQQPAARPSLLLIVGAGRSGTSTVTGSLKRLGYAVPQPEVPADVSNPRGFYEPQWVVDFHQRILDEIWIRADDARPLAVDLAAEASARPDLIEELAAWLEPLAEKPRIVVKDPRTLWMHDLWRAAADQAGMDVSFLTMLRPPPEVVKSRDTHYLSGHDQEERRARETTAVAAWCLGTLVSERITRADRRTFVRYHDLMADWRAALTRAGNQLGDPALHEIPEGHHPIDDFIEPRLHRSQVGWADLSARAEITDIADDVWEAVTRLVEDPFEATASATLDLLRKRYDDLYGFAADLTLGAFSLERQHINRLRAENEHLQRTFSNRLIGRLRRRWPGADT